MKKFLGMIGIILVIVIIVLGVVYCIDLNRMEHNEPVLFSTWGRDYALPEKEKLDYNEDIGVILTIEDDIKENSAWCGTFQLIWNDLKSDLAKQDIVFIPQPEVVNNLNKGTFNTSKISDSSYYKVYGRPSLELKAQIEKAIKDKFNETSDILDDFDWNNATENDWFLYAMLKKEFHFEKEFTELKKDTFGKYENVSYFGINSSTDEQVKEQVKVLYYHSKDDFAIKLLTKENDEVIITKGGTGNTFGKVYENILENASQYKGSYSLMEEEKLKIPNIKFKVKEEIKEVENKPFYFSNGEQYYIEKALQTIEFELDKTGGKIKSEAGMMNKAMSILNPDEVREFLVDDTFTIFLKEKEKDMPYFAARISDITKFQE